VFSRDRATELKDAIEVEIESAERSGLTEQELLSVMGFLTERCLLKFPISERNGVAEVMCAQLLNRVGQ
jgi:hypothetical protein